MLEGDKTSIERKWWWKGFWLATHWPPLLDAIRTPFQFIGVVYRTKTMHQLLCFKSKFLNHFAFTLGCYLLWFFFGSSLLNVDIDYSCSLKCIWKIKLVIVNFTAINIFIFKILGDKWLASVLDQHLKKRSTKSKKKCMVIVIVNSQGLTWTKWTSRSVVFHKKRQSLMILPFSFN